MPIIKLIKSGFYSDIFLFNGIYLNKITKFIVIPPMNYFIYYALFYLFFLIIINLYLFWNMLIEMKYYLVFAPCI